MILSNNTIGAFFRLDNLIIPAALKEKIIDISNSYKEWPAHGNKNRELYILSHTIDNIPELSLLLNLVNADIRKDIRFNIQAIAPGSSLAAHTDPDRYSAINIPIVGNYRTSYIQFFEQGTSEKIVTDFIKNDGTRPSPPGVNYPNPKLVGRVYYDTPICINTSKIHNVKNMSKISRVVLSLGFETTRFSTLEDMHKENKLLV